MKKFFVSIAIFAVMFLTVSCGGDSSSSGGNGGNNSNDNNGGDEDGFYCTDTSSVCSDGSVVKVCGNISGTKGYYDVNGKKFEFDPNDQNSVKEALLKADEECSKTDSNGDSEGEGGESETPADVSECSANGSFPCKDSANGLVWSAVSKNDMNWNKAVSYCEKLTEGGLNSWRLPTISELRTILQNCEGTVVGGACGVTDSCLSNDCYFYEDDSCFCDYQDEGGTLYSKLGDDDSVWLWSSSIDEENPDGRWIAYFDNGGVGYNDINEAYFVRCVKNAD